MYVLRFIANIRTKTGNISELTAVEMDEALLIIVKLVQQEAFLDLFKLLSCGSQKRNNYSGLSPFVDSDGLIRVGGRLKYSSIPFDGKHQLLLPDKHQVTLALIRKLHEEHLHVGQRGLLYIVRERFWPINAKSLIKKRLLPVTFAAETFHDHPVSIWEIYQTIASHRRQCLRIQEWTTPVQSY